MRPTLIIVAAATGFATLLSLGTPARAQANRTFVSGHGSDTNPCSLAAPCRSFAQALSQTNAAGEITILDPAGYGPVTIDRAISIVNDGVGEAGVTTSSATDAITINAGLSDIVNLRGLTLVGGGVGNNGITINGAGEVNIQNSVIRGFHQNGINMVQSGGGSSFLSVLDTTISSNTGDGIFVLPNGTLTVRAVFKRVQAIDNGGSGFDLNGQLLIGTGTFKGTAIDSLATGNSNNGFLVNASGAAVPNVFEIINCQAVDNHIGVGVDGAGTGTGIGTIYLAQTTISDNGFNGYLNNGGTIFTFGNNFITQTANSGSLTPISQQ